MSDPITIEPDGGPVDEIFMTQAFAGITQNYRKGNEVVVFNVADDYQDSVAEGKDYLNDSDACDNLGNKTSGDDSSFYVVYPRFSGYEKIGNDLKMWAAHLSESNFKQHPATVTYELEWLTDPDYYFQDDPKAVQR